MMLAYLADVSIRSLLLAALAALALWILKRHRTAALQHAVWTVVMCGMLGLFAFGPALPRFPLRILDSPPAIADQPVAVTFLPMPETAQLTAPIPAYTKRSISWSQVVLFAYASVAFALLARFATGMLLIRRLIAKGNSIGGFLESEIIAVPLTVGCLRPKILLPLEWREWGGDKLDAVLAHEGAHVRRRDNLASALAGVNRCIFWFHPLAWMLERKLALLAEQACDEACVAALGDRDRYAGLLLEMARVVDGTQGRLRRHALSMASGTHVARRIESLLQEGRTFSRGLSQTGWAAVMLCGIPLVLGAGVVALDHQPAPLRIEIPHWALPAPPPVTIAQARPTPAPPGPLRREFDVASVRPAAPMPPSEGGRNGRGGGPPVGANNCGISKLKMDPDRIDFRCVPLAGLVAFAFGVSQGRVTGPDWMMAEQFDVAATLPLGATEAQVPEMMQALLADRFKLAIHRGRQEQAGYALTVDQGGLKVKAASDGTDDSIAEASPCPPQNFNCAPSIRNLGGIETRVTPLSPQARTISNARIGTALETRVAFGQNRLEAPKTTLEGLADLLTLLMGTGAPVVDATGVKGPYQIVLETSVNMDRILNQAREGAAAQAQPGGPASPVPSPSDPTAGLGEAIQNAYENALLKLGLRLEPRKAAVETVVVDHVERTPTEN